MYGQAGFPDIICCYKGRFVAFGIKTDKGQVTKLQEVTIDKIRAANGIAVIVRSVDEVKNIISEMDELIDLKHEIGEVIDMV